MFAQMAHQLQLFSLLLFLLATIKFKPAIELLSYEQSVLALTGLISFSFLLSLGHKSKFKTFFLPLTLGISILLTVNSTYLHPTLGTLVLCIFTFGFFHFLNKDHSFVRNLNIKWSNLLVSVGLLLTPLFLITKVSVFNENLYDFALTLSSISVLQLCSVFLKFYLRKTSIIILSTLILVASFLFFGPYVRFLYIYKIFCLILSLTSFLYITFKSRKKILTSNNYQFLFSKPQPVVIGYFLFTAAIGAFFLQTPLAQVDALNRSSLVDSFFTALSAVCVTGLIVLDTPVDFTYFGQFIILILIQLGGLGITTLSAWESTNAKLW